MEKNIELIKLHNKLKNSLLASWNLFLEIDKIIHDWDDGKKLCLEPHGNDCFFNSKGECITEQECKFKIEK